MPELKKVYGSYKGQGLVLIGIHCDKDLRNRDATVKKNGLPYPICQAKESLTPDKYQIDGYPTVFVIDRKGKVVAVDPDNLEVAVKAALAKK